MPHSTRTFALAAIVVVLVLSGPGWRSRAAQAAETPVYGGTLRVVSYWKPRSFDPAKSVSGFDHNYLYSVYDTLVDMTPELKLAPGLAKRWDMPDPRTVVLHLQEGVTFHDGTPFNASAVKWNIERHMDPQVASVQKGDFANVERIDVIDERTVKVTLKSPASQFLLLLADRGGMMLSPTAVQKHGKDYGTKVAVGTGPYRLLLNRPDEKVEMEAYPAHWRKKNGGPPYLDRLTYSIVPDDATHLLMLENNQVDLVFALPAQEVDRVKKNAQLTLHRAIGARTRTVYLNPTRDPLGKRKVRQALNYAIDRKALAEVVDAGYATPAITYIPPSHPMANRTLTPYPYDPAKARELLREAGYPDGISVPIDVPTFPDRMQAAQAIEAMMKKAGISLEKSIIEPVRSTQRIVAADIHMALSEWTGRGSPLLTLQLNFTPESGFGGARNRHEDAKDVDKLIKAIDATSNPREQEKLFHEVQKMISDRALELPLTHPDILQATRKNVRYTVYGDGKLRLGSAWLAK
jgi:peptide/nickel transport system substrate-binding protein